MAKMGGTLTSNLKVQIKHNYTSARVTAIVVGVVVVVGVAR